MINTAIFDFDGTLANTLPLCREAFRRAVQDLDGRTLTDEEIEQHFGPDDLGVIQRLLPGHPELHEAGRKLFIKYYEELHPQLASEAFPGMIDLLTRLRDSGIRLAMVTGKRKESAEISLSYLHLKEFFPVLGLGDPERIVKAERIKDVLSAWDISADEAVYVGDAPSDVEACRAVPIRIIAAGWAPGADLAGLKEKNPDFLFTDLVELENFFRDQTIEIDTNQTT